MRRVQSSLGMRRSSSFFWTPAAHHEFERALSTLNARGAEVSAAAIMTLMGLHSDLKMNDIERHLKVPTHPTPAHPTPARQPLPTATTAPPVPRHPQLPRHPRTCARVASLAARHARGSSPQLLLTRHGCCPRRKSCWCSDGSWRS